MPSSGYRKQTVDFGDMALDLQKAAASFTQMSAAAASFVSFVGAFKAFELQVTKVNSAVGGSAKTFKQLSDSARNFALISKYSAGEAASSMVMLAQAGFDAQEAMSAMPSILQLAQASMENLDLVADTVASTIRTYNLNATDAARITNLFAASAVNSLATVNKLAFSFRQVGPVAAELGLSVEETAAALDILYNRGLRGEQAGTALRNILIRLIKPTQDTYETFYRLGIALKDSNGQLRNYQDILRDLGTRKVSDTALTKMFGREALAGAKTLIAATTGEYQRMLETITDTNTAARMANAQMKTMDGSLKLIKNSLTELGIIVGESVGPVVKKVADLIQDLGIFLRTADKETISSIKHFAQFAGTLYLVEKASTSLYAKLVKVATVVNKIATVKNIESFFKSVSPTGELTQAQFLRLHQIGTYGRNHSGGANWYANMYAAYAEMTKGGKLTMEEAAKIKELTKAQALVKASSMKMAFGLNAVTASLKAMGLALLKLTPVLLAAWAAFKIYDNWAKERERREQMKEDLFPELTQLVDKLKEAKLAVTKDLPDIANAYKANMEAMRNAQRSAGSAAGFFANYGLTQEAIDKGLKSGKSAKDIINDLYYTRIREFGYALAEVSKKGETLSAEAFYKLGREKGIDVDLLSRFFDRYEEMMVKAAKGRKNRGDLGVILAIQGILDEESEAMLEVMTKASKESIRGWAETLKNSQKFFQAEVDLISKSIAQGNTDIISKIITKQDAKAAENRSITTAYIKYLYGIPDDVTDIGAWFRDHMKESYEKFKAAKEQNEEDILKGFLESNLFKGLSKEQQAMIKVPVQVDGTANLQVVPVDLNTQESVVAQLKKQYEDLLADYKLSWELLSENEYAYEKIAALQREIDTNNATLAATTDKVFKDIFQQVGRTFNADAAKKTLDAWKESASVLGQIEDLMSTIEDTTDSNGKKVQKLSEEQKKYIELKLLELELQYKINAEKNKELEKNQHIYDMENDRYIYQKGYLSFLDEEIKNLDNLARTEFFSAENFENGIKAGVMSVAKDVDTSYDMMKKGMQGFADFMTDSMNNVVDAWGKGWNEMKTALKNTLADMLKDLAHYFMKQAIYTGITSLAGSFMSTPTTGVLGTVGGKQIIDSNYTGPLAPNQYFLTKKNGGAFQNGLQTFANGGIVAGPTLFNHRFGKGLMGEAGPEAIMPLRRDSQGRLGVSVAGGSTMNYAPTFNINMATGEADSETSQRNANRMTKELDNKVKSAVLLVLAKEKRPGGLLYGR